jgi:hypothetical protein
LPEEFFGRPSDPLISSNINFYKEANITRFEVFFANEGIDLFAYATSANYFLIDEGSQQEIRAHYNLQDGVNLREDNDLDPNVRAIPE